MSNHKKVVITGASGFLGRNLLAALSGKYEYSVTALSSDPESLKAIIPGDNIQFFYKDIIYVDSSSVLFDGSIVINCAYPRNTTGANIADGLKYIQRLFEISVENNAAAVVNISSQSVYSPRRNSPAKESDEVSLESSYAVGKYATELMLESVCRNRATKYTNIRLASLIGLGFNQRIVNRLIKQAIDTGCMKIKQNSQIFGFLDVEDAVGGLIKMLNSDYSLWAPVYNLGALQNYNLVTIGEEIKSVLCKETSITAEILIAEGDEIGNSAVDSQNFYKHFNFLPKISIAESIGKIARDAVKV